MPAEADDSTKITTILYQNKIKNQDKLSLYTLF